MSSSSLAPQTTSLLEGGLDLHHTRLEVVHISHTDCVLACVFVCAYAWLCVCVCGGDGSDGDGGDGGGVCGGGGGGGGGGGVQWVPRPGQHCDGSAVQL